MSREALESELEYAEYHLAEAEMAYDQTHDDASGDAIHVWFGDVYRIKAQLEELDER
jgi:hypothetical protein